jgi:hypothetical protein
MSQTTTKLLRAAAQIVGGEEALARRLDVGEVLLSAYLEERRPLPDFLLLRAVDIVVEHTQAQLAKPPAPPLAAGDLPPVPVQVDK